MMELFASYFVAFMLGVIVSNQIQIYLNSKQIRHNSETIRRKAGW